MRVKPLKNFWLSMQTRIQMLWLRKRDVLFTLNNNTNNNNGLHNIHTIFRFFIIKNHNPHNYLIMLLAKIKVVNLLKLKVKLYFKKLGFLAGMATHTYEMGS